jgi:hypothetical protein
MDIISKIKNLNLPDGQYMICGSAILEILKIRSAQDVDILVSPELFEELVEKHNWKFHSKFNTTIENPDHIAGAKKSLDFMKENFTLDQIIDTAYWHDGIPFMNLEMLIEAKTQLGREKDFKDIELIKNFLKK